MIKGCNRKIYHVRNVSGKLFEEVYFVLKDGVVPQNDRTSTTTLAEEAERIIKEASATFNSDRSKVTSPFNRLTAFLVGVISASAIMGIIALLLVL